MSDEPVTSATLRVVLDQVIGPLQEGVQRNTDLLARVDERTIAINNRLERGDRTIGANRERLAEHDTTIATLEADAKTAGTHAGRRWGIGVGLGGPFLALVGKLLWDTLSQ